MKKVLLPFFLFFLVISPKVIAQNCVFFNGDINFPIICFADPALMDGDEIELTTTQFDDDNFIMSLVTTDINGGGLTVDCDEDATVKVIRKKLRINNTITRSSNTEELHEITFETSSVVGACDGQTLTLNARVVQPIPTFSQWGLIIFGLLILNMGGLLIGRMQKMQLER